MIIKFTATQAEQCRYPIDCIVWVFSGDTTFDGALSKPNVFKRGRVVSISMDFIRKKLMYDVCIDGFDGSSHVSVPEENLGFASGCLVTVAPKEKGGEVLAGSVLMCKQTTLGNVYVVSFGCRFEDVVAERVKYRKSETEAAERVATNVSDAKSQQMPQSSDNAAASNISKKSPRLAQSTNAVVPTSIIYQDNEKMDTKLSDTTSLSLSGTTSSSDVGIAHTKGSSDSRKMQKIDAGTSFNRTPSQTANQSCQLRIVVPLWIQKDYRTQNLLFHHLVGHKADDNVDKICQDTNCRIYVHYDGSPDMKGVPTKPITIHIDHHNYHQSSRDFVIARRRIEDILMNFRPFSPFGSSIKEDDSKGRLLYEIASSCSGAHRPKGSTSNAVSQLNPFESNRKHWYMSLLELPYTGMGSKKVTDGHFLLENDVITNVKSSTGCTFKVIGHETTIYCNPYVLVFGQHWAKVDEAVDILRNEIMNHESLMCL